MAEAQRLRFDADKAPPDAAKQHHIEVLRRAGVLSGPTDAIGGVIENKKPGFVYKWLNFMSATDIQRKLSQGYEIVYSSWLKSKCKCLETAEKAASRQAGKLRAEGKEAEANERPAPLENCVSCKGTGVERYPDPKAEMTPHHCEDGTHRWGDIKLSRVKRDVYEAWKALPVIAANEAVRNTRERTLGKFRDAGVEAGREAEDGIV